MIASDGTHIHANIWFVVPADRRAQPLLSFAGLPITPIVEQNLEGAKFWGEVLSVVDIDRDVMLNLVRFMLDSSVQCKQPVR